MDDPKLYSKVNDLQRKDTEKFLGDYFHLINWNENGDDIILDVGCGTGNVTCEILLPMLPDSVKEIIAVDVNKKMITTASASFSDLKKVKFCTLDIGGDMPEHLLGKFDHVFSFFCLHWIQNQRKLMENIYSLLRPGGDILFCMVGKAEQIYTSYLEMANDSKWKNYLNDLPNIMLPYRDEINAEYTLKQNLEHAGFIVEMLEHQLKEYIFYNDKSLTDFMKSINPFIKRLPEKDRQEFMDHFINKIKLKDPKKINDRVTRKYYSLLLAYAHKPK